MKQLKNIGKTSALAAIAGLWLMVATWAFVFSSATAQTSNDPIARVFTVYGIEVDERASSATQARTTALRQAEMAAFTGLLRKIAPEDDLIRLGDITPQMVRAMVLGVVVHDERTAPGRYIARLDIAFSPEHVREMLGLAGVAYSEVSGGPFVLLPVWQEAGTEIIFEANPWRDALLAADMPNRMMQYGVPDLRFSDRVLLGGAVNQASWAPNRNQKLEERFGTSNMLRAIAQAEQTRDGGWALAISWHDPARVSPGNIRNNGLTAGHIRLLQKPNESKDDLISRGADTLLGRLDSLWKERTLTQFGAVNRFDASVVVHTAEQWAEIRRRIRALAIVRDLEVRQLGVPVSYFTILYAGGPEQLRLVMKNVDLQLVEEYDGWRLMRLDPQ